MQDPSKQLFTKGDFDVGITLKQLYDRTKTKFKLSVLAGKCYMDHEVSRLYYMEDTKISGWTRHGELIITMLMTYHTEEQIKKFIDSFLPYDPPGIMINIGGYINTIPQSVIDHCEKLQIPLLIFPWEIYLQDIMQTFTNMIFETKQKEYNISSLFLNAIFDHDAPKSYEPALVSNGFSNKLPYVVVVLNCSEISDIEYHFFRSELLKACSNVVFCKKDNHLIIIFYQQEETSILAFLTSVSDKCGATFPNKIFHIGIGDVSPDLLHLKQSYDRACICEKLCFTSENEVKSFLHLGFSGILATSDPDFLHYFYQKTLGPIITYDKEYNSCYVDTLKAYILYNGNTAKISEALFIHRNTVNYRLKKIEELFHIHLNDFSTITNFQIAFNILYLFDHTNL